MTKTTDARSFSQTILPLSRRYSIGWDYSECGISESDRHFVVTVVAYEETAGGVAGKSSTPTEILNKQFVIEMHPRIKPVPIDDVSGVLGLLSQWCSADDKEAHDQFERALSEIQMWTLYACLKKSKAAGGRSVILIQGPLLPKLRGRILYRMLDFEHVSLYVITSQPEWIRHLVTGKSESVDSGPYKVIAQVPEQSTSRDWTGPIPALAIDSPTREFVGRRLKKNEVHVTVPANTLPARNALQFWKQCKQELEDLFKSHEPLHLHKGAMLPSMLCKAIREARESKERLLASLRATAVPISAEQYASAPSAEGGTQASGPQMKRDLFAEPALFLECTDELFDLPPEQNLSKFANVQMAKRVFEESRKNLIAVLRKWPINERPTGRVALQKWSEFCHDKLVARGRDKGKMPTPTARSEQGWRERLDS